MATPLYSYVFQPLWSRLFPEITPELFKFRQDDPSLPFSSDRHVLGTLAVYLILVHGGQWVMKSSRIPAIRFKWLFFLHNALLSLGSALLLGLILENLLPRLLSEGS
jgi:hypothetical protein